METLRHVALQRELKRIEQEAEARSFAIMNKADLLASATELCLRVSVGMPEDEGFTPRVIYDSTGVFQIRIAVYGDSRTFLDKLTACGLEWTLDENPLIGTDIYVRGYEDVDISVYPSKSDDPWVPA